MTSSNIAFSCSSDAVLVSPIVAKRRYFTGLFSFRSRKKLQETKSGEYGGWGIITMLFVTKNHEQTAMSRCIVVILKPWIFLPQVRASSSYCFTQTAHNLKAIFLIDCTTFWQKLMMHHVVVLEENSEQIFNIQPNLTCFDRSLLVASFGIIELWFRRQLEVFWANLDCGWRHSTAPEKCSCDGSFV